jgi:energy-coupling factor transporter transmembrane protein EcfT
MNERVKAGLKAGAVWAICIIMLNLFFYSIIIWIFYFVPGVLAVHFGRNSIRIIKDAVVSSLIAAIFSWFLSGMISSLLFSRYFFSFISGNRLGNTYCNVISRRDDLCEIQIENISHWIEKTKSYTSFLPWMQQEN